MTLYTLETLMADFAFLALMVGVVVGIFFLVKAKAKAAAPPPQVPDWYPDPADAALLRYFDGQRWTEATRPRDAPPNS
ncbi:DUF2510 domain-containing protein [Mycolicibacter minnesotensis]|uniref:DUF2510 domain-containing protein n=1 Tax=Mycolicibacter minnesotensis TaxID=1118379 RepID=UPI00138D947B|nr:DUF2510 domain-containing protein [Mycolicibacter minnesotensis]BBY35662.1 hypothetical protein MMIN_37230 [Mycolicibacter minnesotensis]